MVERINVMDFQKFSLVMQIRLDIATTTTTGDHFQLRSKAWEGGWIVGHCCTGEGRIVDNSRITAIKDWTVCLNKSNVCSFLGTVGVIKIFIRNFAHRAHHLVKLTRKDIPWEWGEEWERAMEDLWKVVIKLPALKPLDYKSESLVILAVDTSYIAIGYFLCQCMEEEERRWNYSHFVSLRRLRLTTLTI